MKVNTAIVFRLQTIYGMNKLGIEAMARVSIFYLFFGKEHTTPEITAGFEPGTPQQDTKKLT